MTENENRSRLPSGGQTEDLLSDFGAPPRQSADFGTQVPPRTEEPVAHQATPAEAAPSANDTGYSPKTSAPPKSTQGTKKKSSNTGSAARSGQAKVKNTEARAKKGSEEVNATTATPNAGAGKRENTSAKKAPAVDLETLPRSLRPAHKVIPYVLGLLAVYVGLSLLLNLFCNQDNQLAANPSAHWMGLAGYHICYVLFGLFGPAVFVLPFLMINMAVFWKSYVDDKQPLVLTKTLASLLFLVVFSAVIHVVCLTSPELASRPTLNFTVEELMQQGVVMTGGGVLGGKLGYFMLYTMSTVGSLIIGISVLVITLFYFFGMTPRILWNHIRLRRVLHAKRALGVSEMEAEAAHGRAKMEEKIRRTTDRSAYSDGVTPVQPIEEEKKNDTDKAAPVPTPRLDPGEDNRLFVPSDIDRMMHDAERKKLAEEAAREEPQAEATVEPKKEEAAPTLNPAQNRDAAVEPIFPKTVDLRTNRKLPKEDRDFDLRHVFVELDDDDIPRVRKHAPVPPEVPLAGARPTQAPAVPNAAPLTQTPPTVKTATAVPQRPMRPTVSQEPARPVAIGKAPNVAAVRPAPVGTKGAVGVKVSYGTMTTPTEFGLTDEQFEAEESKRNGSLPIVAKPAPKPKKPTEDKPLAKPDPTPIPKAYVFPPISYLHPPVPMAPENIAEIEENSRQLAATLESFHVRVDGINFSSGPTVTRYEITLAPGVRVRNVINLSDDIALALRVSGGVRIEAPIPGTNAIGIEVPNKTRNVFYLRELIESQKYIDASSKLTACLGADIVGKPLVFDIAKMPHLLVAGTTGSGKSVCINCIIMSLLYKARPDEVKLVLIDPKKVEFTVYKNIPHLMAPVVTTPKDAAGALQAAVEEMERRYEEFENVGVRNLEGYHKATANDPDKPHMPYIVIIIDELADLMMTAKQEVETAICRIAQKARAAGMHLIIGTQRPSADVVTGLIKANVPSAIAFTVRSQIDSRVILDHGGAETLAGKGDMLFVPIGAMRDTRVQGALVENEEVEKICEFIRATNGTAQYDERFIKKLKELAAQCGNKGKSSDDVPVGADGEKGDDPKYADAVRVAIEENRISTSLLQRKLEVGYSRAAKLIDRMQSEGIVSPPDGSKPRSILISADEYFERFSSEAPADEGN